MNVVKLALALAVLGGCKEEPPSVAVHDLTRKTAEVARVVPAPDPSFSPPPGWKPGECVKNAAPFWHCPFPDGNPMPLTTFKATSVEKPTVFKVSGKLSDYYNFEFSKSQKTHYSIEIREDPRVTRGIHVYISRDHPTAAKLFELVSDSEPHPMTVEIAYATQAVSNDVAQLLRFVKAGW